MRLAAEPGWRGAGEFTERAFLSGRIDLTQAEAVRDLIDAQTILQARSAAEQMGGALSRRIAPVKEQLFSLIAVLEAGIDFADDDIDVMPSSCHHCPRRGDPGGTCTNLCQLCGGPHCA